MIVVSLLGLFIAAVYETVITGLRTVNAADDRAYLQQRLSQTLELFAREASVANNVDEARTDEFNFDTPSTDLDYEYDSSAGTLSREGDVILVHLTAFDFDYVNCLGATHTGTVSGSAEDTLRVVQVTATMARDTETFSMTSSTFLRNMLGQESGTCGSS